VLSEHLGVGARCSSILNVTGTSERSTHSDVVDIFITQANLYTPLAMGMDMETTLLHPGSIAATQESSGSALSKHSNSNFLIFLYLDEIFGHLCDYNQVRSTTKL
jgi:hypothetical protein